MNVRLSRGHALALVAAAPAAAFPRPARAQATPIRVGAVVADTYAEGLFASDSGFFTRAGLDVDVRVFPGSGAVAVAAAGNALDVGLTDAVVLANAINRGVPLVAIAGSGLYLPGEATALLCVGRDAPYKKAKDFEGQAVAVVTLVSISSTGVKAWFAKNGADLTKIRFIEMPFPEMPAAIARGSVAGAFLAEPTLSQAADVRILADTYAAIGNRFLISNWFTTRDWLARNPDLARRLVATIYLSARWANQHRDLTAPILVKYAKLDPEKVHAMRRCPYAVTALRPELLQPVLDAAARFKTIEHPVNAADLIATV
jgi:NitT/TauT family transport system substrate-binding protein